MIIRSASKMQPFGNREDRNQIRKGVEGPENARAIFSGWGPKL